MGGNGPDAPGARGPALQPRPEPPRARPLRPIGPGPGADGPGRLGGPAGTVQQQVGNQVTGRLLTSGAGSRLGTGIGAPILREADLGGFGERELANLRTVRPAADTDVHSAVSATVSTEGRTGATDLDYDFSASAKGQRGSIQSRTNVHLHHESADRDVLVQPTNPELKLVGEPKTVMLYPVTLTYTRTIGYTDEYGRSLDVELRSMVVFTREAWIAATGGHPSVTLAELEHLAGTAGEMWVRASGTGNLANLLARDYPNLPEKFKQPMLAGPEISYLTTMNTTGYSLAELGGWVAAMLRKTPGSFPIKLSEAAGNFVRLDYDAGQQYDSIRAYLESADAVDVAQRLADIEERLRNPGTLVSGASTQGGSVSTGPGGAPRPGGVPGGGRGWLDDIFDAIAGFWNSMPSWLRGTLKAVGKAGLTIAAVVGLAAVIVALAPVELTVAGVALAIGAVLMIGSFLESIYLRSVESFETGTGNPLTVFFIAIGDTLGITGIIQASTDRSVLSGRSLNLDDTDRWEMGVGGALNFIMTALGVRSVLRGGGARTADVPAEPATRAPEPAMRPAEPEPLFENLGEGEIDVAIGQAETPAVTGGRSNPRIGGRRVPTGQRTRPDIEDIPLQTGESGSRAALERINRVIGHRLNESRPLDDAWHRAADQVTAEHGALTRDNYPEHYDAARKQFWRNVRDNPVARDAFENAGFEFPPDRTTAPVLRGASGRFSAQEWRISLDHILEKAQGDNWQRALDSSNLKMEFQNPNSYREAVQARHPDLRPPPPSPPPTPPSPTPTPTPTAPSQRPR
jgi:hypothetical protein